MRRCASTTRPASWSAPVPTAAWPTRCETTFPCCWSVRHATLPQDSQSAHADHPREAAEAGGGHGDSPRAVLAALAANLGIAATKFIAFVITGSASLLAES